MSDHDDHDHPHPALPDKDDGLTYYQTMEVAVRELLIDKGILTADEVRRQIEDMDGRNAGLGARMVARAWVDPEYKRRMLTDGTRGRGSGPGPRRVQAGRGREHPAVHNVIVCTLCSCYPRWLLGLPARLVQEPQLSLARGARAASCAARVRA